MPSLINGLRYVPLYAEIRTEEQLLEIFSELRKDYGEFRDYFGIIDEKRKPVQDFKTFLETAIRGGRFIFKNLKNSSTTDLYANSVEYDASSIRKFTTRWDSRRDGTCHSCTKASSPAACAADAIATNCMEYDALVKNSRGEQARKLSELIEEASKETAKV